MKAKNLPAFFLLVVLIGLTGGCHKLASDDYNDYDSSSGSYGDGFRDGRAYERRRETGWAYTPWERYGYYRR